MDANGPTLRTEVEDELAKKQAEIADQNAVRNWIEIIIIIFTSLRTGLNHLLIWPRSCYFQLLKSVAC